MDRDERSAGPGASGAGWRGLNEAQVAPWVVARSLERVAGFLFESDIVL